MFVNIMRSNQRWLMGIISVLVIISFIWFYSDRTQVDRMVSDRVGSIYGRSLTSIEVDRVNRQLRTAGDMGLRNLVSREVIGQGDEIDAVVNHLVVAHQAEAMGIFPSNDEVTDAEQKLEVFQTPSGQFDPTKYAEFVTNYLTPRGFSEDQLAELVREDLQFGKLRSVVDAPVVVSPMDTRLAYEQYSAKTNASVIHLAKSDFAAGIKEPTDDEIKKSFEDQKQQYIQPEKRKVEYVTFALTDEQKKLVGKPKMDALQPLANDAVALLTNLLDNKGKTDFTAAAATAKLPVKQTGDFEKGQFNGLPEASIPGFVQAAFQLTKDNPDSDVPLQTPDAFYDLHLLNVTPPRPLTLEEARPKVVEAIEAERTAAALAAKAEEVRTKVADGLKAGHSFVDAAKDAGQTAQDLPAFSQAEPARMAPDAAVVAETTRELGVGELSKFVPTSTGGLLVFVRSRAGIDEAKFDQRKEMIGMQLEQQKAAFYFTEWLRTSREAANADIIPRSRRS